MGRDRTTSSDNTNQNQNQAHEAAFSNLAQDLTAPGSKIDKSNCWLSARNDSLKKDKVLPNCELTGAQASIDSSPGSGRQTDVLKPNTTQTTAPDANGQTISVTIKGHDVTVAASVNGKQLRSFEHTDVDPASVKLNPNGNVTMDRVTPAGVAGLDPSLQGAIAINGQEYYKIGTVSVAPNGQETTVLHNCNDAGDITVVRAQSGGDLQSAVQDVNGVKVDLTKLSGVKLDGDSLHYHPPHVEVDAATAKVKSYYTADSVKVSLDDNGKPKAYTAGGFTFEHHDDGWYYHQDSGGDFVKINEPQMHYDGTVSTAESGGWNDGRAHSLDGGGQRTGGTVFSAAVGNFAHTMIDDNISAIPNLIGQRIGNHGLANWSPNLVNAVDANNSSSAEQIGGAIGSIASLLVPGFGEEEAAVKAERLSEKLGQVGQRGAKNEQIRATVNIATSEKHPEDWKWWYNALTQ